jgi:hypothetical protein
MPNWIDTLKSRFHVVHSITKQKLKHVQKKELNLSACHDLIQELTQHFLFLAALVRFYFYLPPLTAEILSRLK